MSREFEPRSDPDFGLSQLLLTAGGEETFYTENTARTKAKRWKENLACSVVQSGMERGGGRGPELLVDTALKFDATVSRIASCPPGADLCCRRIPVLVAAKLETRPEAWLGLF